MSSTFVRGRIASMEDLAREKKRLKQHTAITQAHLVEELEKVPSVLLKNVLWKNAGTIAKVAGAVVLGKTLTSDASENSSKLSRAANAAGKGSGWTGLAINAGVFVVGELMGYLRKRKEIKEKKEKGLIIEVEEGKKGLLSNLFKRKAHKD